jgi:hypothetical protein
MEINTFMAGKLGMQCRSEGVCSRTQLFGRIWIPIPLKKPAVACSHPSKHCTGIWSPSMNHLPVGHAFMIHGKRKSKNAAMISLWMPFCSCCRELLQASPRRKKD